jgi:tryptophan 2,3-dioxygenase
MTLANALFVERENASHLKRQSIENSFTAIVSNAVALDPYFQSSKIDFLATVIYQETISDSEIALPNNEKTIANDDLAQAIHEQTYVDYEQACLIYDLAQVNHEQACLDYDEAYPDYIQARVDYEQAYVNHERAYAIYEQAGVDNLLAYSDYLVADKCKMQNISNLTIFLTKQNL